MPEKLQKMVLKQQVHKKLRITEFQKSDRIAPHARKQLAVLVEEHQAAFQHLHHNRSDFWNYKNLVLLENAAHSLEKVVQREVPLQTR